MLAQPTPLPRLSVPTRHVAVTTSPTYAAAPTATVMVAIWLAPRLTTSVTTPATFEARITSEVGTRCVAPSVNEANTYTLKNKVGKKVSGQEAPASQDYGSGW
eukprot:scaffold31231_cov75-Phaeocystis_antarctica.AAC.2